MELHGKEGITQDFLSLHKESPLQNSKPPPSPGQQGRAAAIDLNVIADQSLVRAMVKPEWASSVFRAGLPGHAGVFRPWTELDDSRRGTPSHPHQWPSSSSAPGPGHSSSSSSGVFPSSCRQRPSREGRDAMDASSRLKGFADDEDDDEEFLRETPSRKGLSIRMGRSNISQDGVNDDRKPSTPRSKHSATEQRRRSKINDRFQLLRALIPNTDKKKDKASFLLEVIDYIQLLKEKVEKYEAPYSVWNQDNAKLTPWKNNQTHTPVSPTLVKNGSLPTNFVSPMESGVTPTPSQHPSATAGGFGFFQPQTRISTGSPDHTQTPWLRPSPPPSADNGCSSAAGTAELCADADGLVIDGASISLSSAYSEGLLSALTRALDGLGMDLSQSSISVRINLGRQVLGRGAPLAALGAKKGGADDDSEHLRRPAKRKSVGSG
ncbi:transcription factor BIM2-like isoform X2 [Wolffia australiana]